MVGNNNSKNIMHWVDELPRWLRYTVAVLLPFIAALLTFVLWSVVSPTPGVLFFAAIAVAAWLGGFAPGLASVIASIILLDYFFLSPNRIILSTPSDFVTLSIFGLVAAIISWTENQRRSINLELRASRDELHAVINSVSDGITVQDNQGKVYFANQAASTMTGFSSPTQLMATSIPALYKRFEMRDENNEVMTSAQLPRVKVFEEKQSRKIQFQVIDHELKQQHWREVTTTPIFDDNGNVRLVANVIRDITATKEMDHTIRYERRRLQSVLDELGVFVGLLDLDGIIVEVNRSATHAAGLEASDLIGTAMYDTYAWSKTKETQDKIKDSVLRAAAGETVNFDTEARAVGDTAIFVEYNIAPMRNASGEIEFLIASAINITERKHNEMEMAQLADLLEAERERLARIVNTLPGVVFEGVSPSETTQGGIIFMSNYTEELLGYSPQNWLDNPEFGGTIVHPDDLANLVTNLTSTYERGDKGVFECRLIASDSRIVEVEIRTTPYRNDAGQVTGLVGTMMDITERNQRQQEIMQLATSLETERERLKRIVNTLPGIVYEAVDLPEQNLRNVVYMSDYAETLLGYKPQQWYEDANFGRSIIHPDDLGIALNSSPESYESETSSIVDFRITAADGRTIHVENRSIPYRDPQGDVNGVVGVLMDITQRKEQEHQLALLANLLDEERQRLTRIVNTLPGIIFEGVGTPQDGDQKMVFVSDYANTVLGYPPSRWLDDPKFGSNIVHPDDLESTLGDATTIYESGKQGTLNYRVFAADNRIIHIEARSIPYHDFEGDVTGVVGVMMDVTHRKETEEKLMRYAKELRRSNAELEQFAYVASHDLQEPLRMVGSYLQLIEQRYKEHLDEEGLEFIGYAVDGATRMKKLIQDLLAYSRVQRGKEVFQSCPMENALAIAKRNLTMSVEETHATITSDPLPTIYGNEQQISQLFQNLLGNAIKFHREVPPEIHISVLEHGEDWEFFVRDNGIGIEEQYLERIFIIFQRLHSRDTYSGTGIGLALCRKIVGQHGGRIWVESKVNEGSTFRFTIAKPDILMKEKTLDGLN